MDCLRVDNGIAHMVLTPEDCAILAAACREAAGTAPFLEDGAKGAQLDALNAALKAAGTAALATRHMRMTDVPAWRAELTELGLERGPA